jgi:pimeloyl-ACP methyl ester carboxylesterase
MIVYPMAVGGILTRVLEAGAADAPPIILVHGLTSRADRWRANIDALAGAGYRVLALDLPGHGFATKDPAHDHSVPAYARFVLDFLDTLGANTAVLVGTSLGGQVVGAAAIAAPERVKALVMIGSLGFRPITLERVAAMRELFGDMTPAAMRARLLTVFSDPRFVTDDLVAEDIRVNSSPGAAACLARFLDYMADRFNGDLLAGRIDAVAARMPTLLVWGEEDRSVPIEVGRAARAALSTARLVTLAKTSHTPYLERSDLFNRMLMSFLAGTLTGSLDPLTTYS